MERKDFVSRIFLTLFSTPDNVSLPLSRFSTRRHTRTHMHTHTHSCLGFVSCLVLPGRVQGKQIVTVGNKNSVPEVHGKSPNSNVLYKVRSTALTEPSPQLLPWKLSADVIMMRFYERHGLCRTPSVFILNRSEICIYT